MKANSPELLCDTKWIRLCRRGKYVYATRRPVGAEVRADAVDIIAIHTAPTPTGERSSLVVLRQFRPIVGRWHWSLPAGLIDDGESVRDAARRELSEETGLRCNDHLHESPQTIFTSAGLSDETTSFAFVECEGPLATKPGVGDEQIVPKLIGQKEAELILQKAGANNESICARLWPILYSIATTGYFANYKFTGPADVRRKRKAAVASNADLTAADKAALDAMPDGWFEATRLPFTVRCPLARCQRLERKGLLESEVHAEGFTIYTMFRKV